MSDLEKLKNLSNFIKSGNAALKVEGKEGDVASVSYNKKGINIFLYNRNVDDITEIFIFSENLEEVEHSYNSAAEAFDKARKSDLFFKRIDLPTALKIGWAEFYGSKTIFNKISLSEIMELNKKIKELES
jgi:hypothetical protein